VLSVAAGTSLRTDVDSVPIFDGSWRLLDAGVGYKFAPSLGAGLSATLVEVRRSHYAHWSSWRDLMTADAGGSPLLGSFVVVKPVDRFLGGTPAVRFALEGWGWDGPMIRVSAALGLTWKVVNPEVELSWFREWNRMPEQNPQRPPTADFLSLFLRIGLGGLYER
jgi:hypothetical protein